MNDTKTETLTIQKSNGYFVKKIYVILSLIITFCGVSVAIAAPFVWKEAMSIQADDSIKRIEQLERKVQGLDEIKFNLKSFMVSQGVPYTELNK
jgi:hypothetical protein